jgi:catechol 2,3-dioxygenase-like lactoylglutathione lyase family enzyme
MTVGEAPKVHGVLETCLYATDLESTAEFYERALGLRSIAREGDRHVFFRAGNTMFLLFNAARTGVPDGDVPPHGATGPGHVAFAVGGSELDRWRDRLERMQVRIETEIEWPNGGVSIYLRDPAGNSVELTTPSIWGLPDIDRADEPAENG